MKNHLKAARTSLLTLLIPLGIASMAAGQNPQEVTLQFLSFPRAHDPAPVELLLANQSTMEVEIPTNALSSTYQVPPSNTWVVGETVVGEDGRSQFKELGRAAAINSPSQLIMLIRKGEDHSEGFAVLVMDNRETSFGGGRFLMMNASNVDIAGEVGSERFAIRSGAHSIIRPRSESDERSFHAMFYFRADENVRPFYSTRWPVSDRARSLVFFYNDPANGRIRLHTIRSFN